MPRSLALLLVLVGCTHAPASSPQSLPMPTVVAAPAPPPRAQPWVLAPPQLAYVADASGVFPSMLGTPGPRLVLAVLDDPPPFAEPDEPGVFDVDDETLAELGAARPRAVWMVTPKGACQATVGDGYVGHYAEGLPAYEVGYRLAPCGAGFGPLAVLADELPPELRWVAATVELDDEVDPETWEHPLRDAFVGLGLGTSLDDAGRPAPARWARIVGVEGTPLRQLVAVDHWPAEEACDEQEVVANATALGGGGDELRWLSPPDDLAWGGGQAQLEGAIVDGDVPVVVVHTVRFQAGVGVRDAAGEYQWLELPTGRYHDEDVAFSGYSVRQYCGP